MKKTSYILFILWLSTVVLSNALLTCKSFYDNSSVELTEKESNEKSSNDSDDANNTDDTDEDTEKKSEDKSKSEKELFAYKSLDTLPSEILAALSAKSKIPSNDEDFVSSLYVILPENPPEL